MILNLGNSYFILWEIENEVLGIMCYFLLKKIQLDSKFFDSFSNSVSNLPRKKDCS